MALSGLEASGGAGAAGVLHRVDMTGKIAIRVIDKDPETLDWIDRGGINATVAQKPYVMALLRREIPGRLAPQRGARIQGLAKRSRLAAALVC